jgi:hypothetical protein
MDPEVDAAGGGEVQGRMLKEHPFYGFVVFVFAVWGLANAIGVLKVGHPIREFLKNTPVLKDLFRCPACLGFWMGMAASWFLFSPSLSCFPKDFPDSKVAAMVVDGLVCSGANWILYCVCTRLEFVPQGSESMWDIEERKSREAEGV